MENDIKNKVVAITGANRGIGYEIVRTFLNNGAKIALLLCRSEPEGIKACETLNNTFGEGKAVFVKCDVTKDVERVSSEIFGKYTVEVFVNNAGIADESSIRKTIEVNTIAPVEFAMKAWEHMIKDWGGKGGTILNITSLYAFENNPWLVYYKTSKHGMMGFIKTLGHKYNYEKFGVRVIGLCPGYTKTDMISNPILWECHKPDCVNFIKEQIVQDVETVGQAALQAFNSAPSGTSWITTDNKPLELAPTR